MNSTLTDLSASQLFDQYFHLCATFAILALIGIYLWFVLSFGPEFMKNRDPYNVVDLIRLYNAFQVVACSIFVYKAQQIGFSFRFIWKCEKFEFFTDLTRLEVSIGYWLFLILRCIEFIETVFFVVRKKQSQATFLHIFHHIGSVLMTFLFIIMEAEYMAIYIAIINSCVHMVMYSYYFFSSFQNKKLMQIMKHIKPFITIMQLVQFIIIIVHLTIAILPSCGCGYFFHLQLINFIVLTFLFGQFFIQTYIKKGKAPKSDYSVAQT